MRRRLEAAAAIIASGGLRGQQGGAAAAQVLQPLLLLLRRCSLCCVPCLPCACPAQPAPSLRRMLGGSLSPPTTHPPRASLFIAHRRGQKGGGPSWSMPTHSHVPLKVINPERLHSVAPPPPSNGLFYPHPPPGRRRGRHGGAAGNLRCPVSCVAKRAATCCPTCHRPTAHGCQPASPNRSRGSVPCPLNPSLHPTLPPNLLPLPLAQSLSASWAARWGQTTALSAAAEACRLPGAGTTSKATNKFQSRAVLIAPEEHSPGR